MSVDNQFTVPGREIQRLLDEAKHLREENERLQDVLRDVLDFTTGWTSLAPGKRLKAIDEVARAALADSSSAPSGFGRSSQDA